MAAAAIAPRAKNLLLHGCLLVGNVAAARGYGNGTRGRAGWATAALEYVEALGQNGFKCVFFFFSYGLGFYVCYSGRVKKLRRSRPAQG